MNGNWVDITGRVSGKLTAVRITQRAVRKAGTYELWECRCECGESRIVRKELLVHEKVTACRTCTASRMADAIRTNPGITWVGKETHEGKTYGWLTVLRFDGNINTWRAYLCKCKCGREIRLRAVTFSPSRMAANPNPSCGCRKHTEAEQKKAERIANRKPREIRWPIDPDIQALPISGSLKLKRQWRRMGRCVFCGEEANGRALCKPCQSTQHQRVKERTTIPARLLSRAG